MLALQAKKPRVAARPYGALRVDKDDHTRF